jgi:protein AaeX
MGESEMIGECSIDGVFIPTLLLVAVVSFGLSLLIRRVFRRYRVYRFVWHAGLFDVAVFVVITWVVSIITVGLDKYGIV